MATILVVFGTRPEAIKLVPVVRALAGCAGLTVRTCSTGQHRDLLDQMLAATAMTPDIDLNLMEPGQSLDRLTARLVVGVGDVMDVERPDWIVVQGDTTTAMTAALAAHYRRIPIAHVEAGLRSGDIFHPCPEEANRRIVTALAQLHFAPTEIAAEALRREHVPSAAIHVTGNTVIDALLWVKERIANASGAKAGATRINGKRSILVTTHRRENIGEGMAAIARALVRIADRGDTSLLLPMHPNPAIATTFDAIIAGHPAIIRMPPLHYADFVAALLHCDLVLTDSGGVQEEAPALGKPVLVLRETTERPEGIIAGTARLVGTDEDRIVAEVARLLDDDTAYATMARAHNPYGDGRAAERIAAVIAERCRLPGCPAGSRQLVPPPAHTYVAGSPADDTVHAREVS